MTDDGSCGSGCVVAASIVGHIVAADGSCGSEHFEAASIVGQWHVLLKGQSGKLFALRESRRGNWRQALGGLEAQMCGGSEAR